MQVNAYRDLLRRWKRRAPDTREQSPSSPPQRALVIDNTAPAAGQDAGSTAGACERDAASEPPGG